MKTYFLIVLIISPICASENGNNNDLKNNICGINEHKCDSCKARPEYFCDTRLEVAFYNAIGCPLNNDNASESEGLKEFMKHFTV
jgi:hypothetical protein